MSDDREKLHNEIDNFLKENNLKRGNSYNIRNNKGEIIAMLEVGRKYKSNKYHELTLNVYKQEYFK